MAIDTLETWFFNGQVYITPKEAARYLDIKHKTLLAQIAAGKLPIVHIESRQLIELEALKAYARKRKPSAWDRIDEWRN